VSQNINSTRNKKTAIAKMTAQCALYMGAMKIFRTAYLTMPTATFSFTVRKSVGEFLLALHAYYSSVHWFSRNRLQFSVGVVNPQFLGRGGRRGRGLYHSKECW